MRIPGATLESASTRATGAALPASMPAGRGPPHRQIASEILFNGRAEIEICHGDMIYRLRQTALGKLILTK